MKEILQKVDVERLYKHILSIEGVRHHIENLQKLNDTADYILSEFQKYGLNTQEQAFEIEGSDISFRNIEGYIGDGSKPEILIISHYDTTRISPGADDNGSGVAAMLETARVLSSKNYSVNVRFVSFTLEEINPKMSKDHRNKGLELGIFDEKHRYKNYHTQKRMAEFYSNARIRIAKGQPLLDSWNKSYEEMKDKLSETEKEFCKFIIEQRSSMTRTSWIGQDGLVGSNYWVEKAIASGKQIKGVINLETIGYTSKRKRSQFFPPLMHPLIFPSYKVKKFKTKGNFIVVTSDKYSKQLGKVFCMQCKNKDIKLPFLFARIPLGFEKIAKWAIDTLRSDHAPFWKEKIPALMITDSGNFRNPYYHTEADTIDKLDFEFIKKVTQATIATILEIQNSL